MSIKNYQQKFLQIDFDLSLGFQIDRNWEMFPQGKIINCQRVLRVHKKCFRNKNVTCINSSVHLSSQTYIEQSQNLLR